MILEAVAGAKGCDVAVLFAGLPPAYESEGFDRTDMKLPAEQNKLIVQVADANPNTVVVLAGGAPVEMPWLHKVKAVLNMVLPGQAGGLAAADLLTGAVNPSGKLAESYPICYADVPSAGFFEEGERQAQYREGIFVGYRYYDKAGRDVCFPFGYGLSYTTFEYSDLKMSKNEIQEGETLVVTVIVKNTGKLDGAEIVQLYVGQQEPKVLRPEKELKGFTKIFLHTGQEGQAEFQLDSRSFACYDIQSRAWIVPDGTYQISIGASSRDIRLSEEVMVHGTTVQDDRSGQPSWYKDPQGKPTQADFEKLLGHPVENSPKPRKGEYTLYSSLRDMQHSLAVRIMMRTVENTVAKAFGGVDYSDPNFKGVMETTSTNPLRNLVITSGGKFSLPIARGLVDMANGHFLKGLRSFLQKQ